MRFEIDPAATSRARRLLADEPDHLRRCATRLSEALAAAGPALGSATRLESALVRFRLVEAWALDAVADAAAGLGGRIDTACAGAAVVERSATSALAAARDGAGLV